MSIEEQRFTKKGASVEIFEKGMSREEMKDLVRAIADRYKSIYPEVSLKLEYSTDEANLSRYDLVPNSAAKELAGNDPVAKGALQALISWAKRYPSLPIFTDPFGDTEDDHVLRRKWEKEVVSEFGDKGSFFLNSNKLGENNAIPILTLEELNKSVSDRHLETKEARRLGEMREEIRGVLPDKDAYLKMSRDEKIKFIQMSDGIAKEILDLFAEPIP